MDAPQIRDVSADELDALRGLAVRSGLFAADEAAEVIEAVDPDAEDSFWLSAVDESGALLGAAYTVAEPVSDRVWNMLFLAVDPEAHRSGVGRALVGETESRLRALDEPASALVIETSSGEAYAGARAFYAGLGYEQVGQVPRYYAPDEDKVVLWKALDRP